MAKSGFKYLSYMRWFLGFFAFLSSLAYADPGDLELDAGSAEEVVPKENCESLLVKPLVDRVEDEIDRDVEMIFHKYLPSEPVSKYILKKLIAAEFDVAKAADPKNVIELEMKKKISLEILQNFGDWFYSNVKGEGKIPRRMKLAKTIGVTSTQQENLMGKLNDYNRSQQVFINGEIDKKFVDYFLQRFTFYMAYLKASKVLFRPIDLIYRSDLTGVIYSLFNISVLGGGIFELTRMEKGLTDFPYYSLMTLSLFTGIPVVVAPLLTLAYEKTLGKSRGRKLLETGENSSRPNSLGSHPHFPGLPPPLPRLLPQASQGELLFYTITKTKEIKQKQKTERIKEIQQEINLFEESMSVELESLKNPEVKILPSQAQTFGENFKKTKDLFDEAERILASAVEEKNTVCLVNEMEDLQISQDKIINLLASYLQVGLQICEEMKKQFTPSTNLTTAEKNMQRRLSLSLGRQVSGLYDLQSDFVAQYERFQGALDQVACGQ